MNMTSHYHQITENSLVQSSSPTLHTRPIDTLLSFMLSCQASRYSYPYIIHPIPNLWSSILARLRTHPFEASHRTVVSFPLTSHDNNNISGLGATPLLPLHAALCLKYSPPPSYIVQELITAYPDALHQRTSMGLTALHLASNNLSRDNPEILELILQHAPSLVHIRSTLGHLPLHLARGTEATELLVKAYPIGVSEPDNNGNLPLHYAVGNTEIPSATVKLLLDTGLELESNPKHRLHSFRAGGALVSNISGIHPLKVSYDTVKACISRNEIMEKKTKAAWEKFTLCLMALASADGNHDSPTILHLSVSLFHEKALLRYAIFMHLTDALRADTMGRYPLHVASMKKSIPKEVLIDLIQANPKAALSPDALGRLPLHYICSSGRNFSQGVAEMVQAGPDALTTRDVETGLYPFMMAALGSESSLETSFELLLSDPSIIKYSDGYSKKHKWRIRLTYYLPFLKNSLE